MSVLVKAGRIATGGIAIGVVLALWTLMKLTDILVGEQKQVIEGEH